MTEHAQLELIAAVVTCVMSVLAYLKGRKNGVDIKELKVTVDGRLTQLLDTTASSNRAEGVILGTEATRAAMAAQAAAGSDPAIAAAVIAAREVIAAAVIAARELLVRAQLENDQSQPTPPGATP